MRCFLLIFYGDTSDPDPIRGGKIVIQAKRYTKTVGVSAVRDLYGTVLNEGATKGILVTTADYGPDSYEFAKGKPLTLLNGANLLHLLAVHGHRAKIDLQAARIRKYRAIRRYGKTLGWDLSKLFHFPGARKNGVGITDHSW